MRIGCFALIQPFSSMRRQFELIRAIKLAHFLGVKQVITTEGDPKTNFGHQLGDGLVGIEAIVKELLASGFDGPTTLEVAGEKAVKRSAERLREWSA